jgi:tRNA A-37 threonylcarbamoyl transferase component Bud32
MIYIAKYCKDRIRSTFKMKSLFNRLRNPLMSGGNSNAANSTNANTELNKNRDGIVENPINNDPEQLFKKISDAKSAASNSDKYMKYRRILDESHLYYYEFDNIDIVNDKKTNHQELLYCEACPLNTVSLSKIYKGKLKVWYHTSVSDHICLTETVPYEIIDVAVKVIEHSDAIDNENNEPEILHYLHREPEFVRLFGYHIEPFKKKCMLVLEWCAGGDLFNYIEKSYPRLYSREIITVPISLMHIKHIVRWLITAILKCHMNDICYSDLKLDNIMFRLNGDVSTLKLIDFGASRFIHDHGKDIVYKFISTSVHYTPPEVVNKYYMRLNYEFLNDYQLIGENLYKIDVWQIGIITYVLLNGRFPFDSNLKNKKERHDCIFQQIGSHKELTFSKNKDINGKPLCDSTARDFVRKLVNYNPTLRISLQEALHHPWLNASDNLIKV